MGHTLGYKESVGRCVTFWVTEECLVGMCCTLGYRVVYGFIYTKLQTLCCVLYLTLQAVCCVLYPKLQAVCSERCYNTSVRRGFNINFYHMII